MGYLIGGMIMILSALVCLIFKGIDIVGGKINYLIILYFLGYIVQGMSEEVLCRGFFLVSLKHSMKNKHATLIAVLVSSIAFALLHSVNPGMTLLAMFNLFLSGLFFAFLMLRFDNLWVPCAAHSAWNFFQGPIFGFAVSGSSESSSLINPVIEGSEWITGGSFGAEASIPAFVAGLVFTAFFLYWIWKRNYRER